MARNWPSFAVNVVGHERQRGHIQYLFRVRHSRGCEWTVARRYRELQALHQQLGAVFSDAALPAFPRASSVVGAILSGGMQRQIIADREKDFQTYFDRLCENRDIMTTHCVQVALAVVVPEPVSQLRVRGWLPASEGRWLTALLETRPEGQEAGSCGVVETCEVTARVICCAAKSLRRPSDLVSSFSTPVVGRVGQLRVEALEPGTHVEFEVSVLNMVGRSPPVAIRVIVPAQVSDLRSGYSTAKSMAAVPVLSDPLSNSCPLGVKLGSSSSTSSPLSAAHAPSSASTQRRKKPSSRPSSTGRLTRSSQSAQTYTALERELSRRRGLIERGWAEKCSEAVRVDAELQEKLVDFRSQREAHAHDVESDGSPTRSQVFSDESSAETDVLASADQVDTEWAAIERREREQRTSAEQLEAQVEEHRSAREALEREREELRREREELQQLRVASAAESAVAVGAAVARADLDARFEDLRGEHALLEESRVDSVYAQAELDHRAEELSRAEEALQLERQDLRNKRASLAVVQAHVVAMLDKAIPGSPSRLDKDIGDQIDGAMSPPAEPDGIYSMDWQSLPFPTRSPDGSPSKSPSRSPNGSPSKSPTRSLDGSPSKS